MDLVFTAVVHCEFHLLVELEVVPLPFRVIHINAASRLLDLLEPSLNPGGVSLAELWYCRRSYHSPKTNEVIPGPL